MPTKNTSLEKREFAIVLGASVRGQELSNALRFRMNKAVSLYQKGIVQKILLSGDGNNAYYNETKAMLHFAVQNGVSQKDIMVDKAGYNTYATMLHAKYDYNIHSAYIVTQQFHLRRSVWIARKIGIDALGVQAEVVNDELYYNMREFFANVKDFFLVTANLPPLD